jgi:predicted Zn-dependent protease
MSTHSDLTPDYRARFNDGHTAATLDVAARVEQQGLIVVDNEGNELDCWAWDEIRLTDRAARNQPARLSNRTKPGARLVIDDPLIIAAIRAHARYLSRDPISRQKVWTVAGITAAAMATVAFFIYGLPWIARPAAALVPISWEEPVGDSTVEIINQLFAHGRKLCSGTAGRDALRTMTHKLAATVKTPYDIRVDVVDSGIVNALAAPGGRIVIFRGLIDRATSADEVAGVLAHEMAHVVRRHPTQGMISSIGWSALLSAFTGGASLSNTAVARLATHLATSAHTRELESEADEGAVTMLDGAGIGSAGLARFFKSIEQPEKRGLQLPEYLSSHPQTSKRIEAIERSAHRSSTPALSPAEWQALKGVCR